MTTKCDFLFLNVIFEIYERKEECGVKGIFEGVVMDEKEIRKNQTGEMVGYEILLYQAGEKELLTVRSQTNGVTMGEKVRVSGKVSTRVWNNRVYASIYADTIEPAVN